jgi:hypothetical protein
MSWEQLIAIEREAVAMANEDNNRTPTACPNDGEPLRQAPRGGGLYCPFDGWRPGDPTADNALR